MRNIEEQRIALDCLAYAKSTPNVQPREVVELAERYYAFVTGDDAADTLARVREALTP